MKRSNKKIKASRRPAEIPVDTPIVPDFTAYEKAKEEYERSAIEQSVVPEKKAEPKNEVSPKVASEKENAEESDIFKKPIKKQKKENKKKRKKSAKANDTAGTGVTTGLIHAVIYIVCVLVVSVFLSWGIISVVNDVYAFVKPDTEITINVPENVDVDWVAENLHDLGVIKFPAVFKLYAGLKHKDTGFEGGEYTVSPSNTYDRLLAVVRNTLTSRDQITVTIPEGTTLDDVINIFLEQGIKYSYTEGDEKKEGTLTREGFINVIQNYDFDFDFVRNIPAKEGRKYRLEGYIYPDTYNFYSSYDCTEEEAIAKILYRPLSNFNSKFSKSYQDRLSELGYTLDDIVTLGSIIQHEAFYITDYGLVSSVFHNRLNNPAATNGKLDSDATVEYALPERVAELTEAELSVDSPYNTRLYPGLPPSAICNPGIDAIEAALYPEASDYYYFYSLDDGTVLYASTYYGHLANIANSGG